MSAMFNTIQQIKIMKRVILSFIVVLAGSAHGEDVTLVANDQHNQENLSQPITLNQGDTAKLVFASYSLSLQIACTIGSKVFDVSPRTESSRETNPVTIAGPATIVLRNGGSFPESAFATFTITRTGIASPPAEIPQEAGTTWDVILESSSDLVNWTPTNPGEYSGTEPKRFFRTRMVKKP